MPKLRIQRSSSERMGKVWESLVCNMCNVESDRIPVKICELTSQSCMKCSEPAIVRVRLNDPLCKLCFLTYFTHKFRATLGKSRLVRHDEKVLLAFSGGLSSSAMLHLVSEGCSDRVTRKVRFQSGVVFIEEGSILKMDATENKVTIQKIEEIAAGRGFPFYLARLEDVFNFNNAKEEQETDASIGLCGLDPEARLKALFESVSSLTAKEDLLKSLRRQVLLGIARKEGYTKVMFGDCATRLAVRLLSNISQGRGGALPYDTGFADRRHGDIMFIRPMREFMAKEIGLYNFFHKVDVIRIPSLSTMATSHASIDRLTEGFVCGLQTKFPFTVSTIFRTGDKLLAQEMDKDVLQCSLCGGPQQANKVRSCAAEKNSPQVELLSDSISNLAVEVAGDKSPACDSCKGSGSKMLDDLSWGNITRTLCYGCQLTLKDANCSVDCLPLFVTDSVNKAELKEQIKDFLLED